MTVEKTPDRVPIRDLVRYFLRLGLPGFGEPVALVGQSLTDVPRLFYMHFWATGEPVMLAQGLKAALDVTNSAKPAGSQ